ncbi:kinase-like protein [Schizopora paradoxa]|uniref:Kinase-like protein n=1 Tax=Schizopora paradoxa TaxID=27342 RepID=A0A0H2SHY5_9AGAM|nr:kinase-like protein [Schizopora paradoxa]
MSISRRGHSIPRGSPHIENNVRSEASRAKKRTMEDVVVDIYQLFQLHKSSTVERHVSWLTQRIGTTCIDKTKDTLLQYFVELLSLTKKCGSLALKAICTLTVEEPRVRETLALPNEECVKALCRLEKLEKKRDLGSDVREWASKALNAIQNKAVHDLWSEVITEPVRLEDVQKLSEKSVSCVNGVPVLRKLAETLEDSKSSYVADIYFKLATTLALDGPSWKDVTNLRRGIDIIRQERLSSSVSDGHALVTEQLCTKLLKYASNSVTAVVAMKEILALAITDKYAREMLWKCEKRGHYLERQLSNTNSEIHKWTLRALCTIKEEYYNIHELWSNATVTATDKDGNGFNFQTISVNGGTDISGRSSELAQSLDKCKGKTQQSSKDLLGYVLQGAETSLTNLTGVITKDSKRPKLKEDGGFSIVYQGPVLIKGVPIAVKQLRMNREPTEFVIKNFARELRIIAELSHPNVSTFLGYAMEENESYSIILEWMERTLWDCLSAHDPEKDPESISRDPAKVFDVAFGIAKGVTYLHGENIVHADIKAANILLSRSGRPLVTDFGISRMSESLYSKGFYTTEASRFSKRWVPCEFYRLLDHEKFRPNTKSDVWAYGMTLLEILSSKLPYADIINEGGFEKKIMAYIIPNEPKLKFEVGCESAHNEVWELCKRCWTEDWKVRPEMKDVLWDLVKAKSRLGLGSALPNIPRFVSSSSPSPAV